MDKEMEKILKALETIMKIVIQNNNLSGFICNQISMPPNLNDSMIIDTPEEMVKEIIKNNAQYEIVGES